MRFTRLAALAAVAASLAVPVSAGAHPSVYEDIGRVVEEPGPPPVLGDQTRYVVTNHGFTAVLRESNDAIDNGVMDYKKLPGAYRDTIPISQQLTEGDTGAQVHATCRDDDAVEEPVDALWTEQAIISWEDAPDTAEAEDPFYNYVPFQKTAAGYDDHPDDWIPDVQTLTGVDLSQVSNDPAQATTDLTALCSGIGGTFVGPDAIQTPATSLASGTVEVATEPLLERIDQLESFTAQLQAQKAAAEQAAAGAQAQAGRAGTLEQQNQALLAEVTQLRLEATPLRIQPGRTRSAARLAANGVSVRVTGPAGRRVTVRMLLGRGAAKALGLKSRLLGRRTTTIQADATALVRITVGRRAKAALRRANRSMTVSFRAVAGDRSASASRRLSR
jgi:hypothetical protein